MNPFRVADLGAEPVGLAEMRGYLRLDPDETAEDGLIASLIAASRLTVEASSRRLLRPARFRLMLTAWPRERVLPLPLSPLVAIAEAGLVDETGVLVPFDPVSLRIGPDLWEAPCLIVGPGAPILSGKAALIEVVAGCGGAGPPAPAPLVQAIRMLVADAFENRGDALSPPTASAGPVASLIAPHRSIRL